MTATRNSSLTITLPSDKEILMTRVFDAPRQLVFEAMTKPEHVSKWWGPRASVLTICEIDFRVGGAWRYVMQCNGREVKFKGVFHEIVPPERLVATECYDEPRIGCPEWQTTVTLEERDGKTTLSSRVLHPSMQARDGHLNSGMETGATETFDRLAELLAIQANPMEREIELTRIFDAPRELVYEAWTDPEHMVQWWGPKVFTNHSCQLDVRPGGAWQIVMRSPDGADYGCRGVYSEVVKSERLVFTNDAIDQNGKPLLKGFTTVTFADHAGKTKLTLRTRAIGLVDYAPQMLAGMEQGWSQSLDKLHTHLE
jgi:uncharacterized protein YndB with AHSA1/START domain